MATHNARRSGAAKWLLLIVAAVVVVAGVGAVLASRGGGDSGALDDTPLYTVKRGPLRISVSETGTIQARDQVIIKSEVEGQTTIIGLVPEGTRVSKGDVLVELDSSKLEDSRLDQQIRVQNAEAAFIRARENLEVVKSQATSDISAAELEYQFAQEDLTQYVEGQYPRELNEAESRISLTNEELKRAQEKLEWSEKLFKEAYISKSERDADQLALNRAQLNYDLAVQDKQLLSKYTHERKLAELNSNIEQTKMKLDRVRRKAKADVIQADADLKAKESEHRQQQDKLNKIDDQIAKTKIIAPINGMVIYATSAKFSWRGNDEPLAEGQSVRERQELIHLPTADSMKVEIKIHESSLDKISLGQRVRVTVDALPGEVFTGKVGRIAPLPDATSVWLNPDLKVFSTDVYLDNGAQMLRTGMSCRAEIIVKELDDVVYVPVQSVVRHGNTPTVYVREGDRALPRAVKLGLDNNRMVHIVDGLSAGEQVMMAPPLTGGPAVDEPEAEPTPREDKAEATEEKAQTPEATSTETAEAGERGGEMTEEQRAERRKRFENMSPEQREKMRAERRQRSGQEGAAPQ